MSDERNETGVGSDCVVPELAIPAEELRRYGADRDPHREKDIRDYVELEAEESVRHVEKVKQEVVIGDLYEIWDVVTDENRWWVVTNPTKLYSQKHFPSRLYAFVPHRADDETAQPTRGSSE